MRLESAFFQDFAPFCANAEIQFPAKPEDSAIGEVHFLVGCNGSGKTRLLSLLAAALGNRNSLAVRVGAEKLRAAVIGEADGLRGCWTDLQGYCGWLKSRGIAPKYTSIYEGQLSYVLSSKTITSVANLMTNENRLPEPRFALAFRGTTIINDEAVEALKPVALNKEGEHLTLLEPDAESRRAVAQSLVNLKMRAAMDSMQTEGSATRAMRMSASLEKAMAKITGRPFSFTVTYLPKIALSVTWGGATMQMMQLPDGLRAIVGWLAAAVGKLDAAFPDHPDPLSLPIVLLIDEPEAHLHPQWQRQVLPAIQHLLPNAQIIAATHSAFAISSVNEGWIHILKPNAEGKVSIEKPIRCTPGDSWLDVVEDILGVKEWYDPETEDLLKQFREKRDAVLSGKVPPNAELEELARSIGKRGPALSDMMGREMAKIEKLRAESK